MPAEGPPPYTTRWLAVLVAAALAGLPGCSGCRRDSDAEARKKAEQEAQKARRPDFELLRLLFRPHESDRPQDHLKPGHWTSATLEARANNFDFRGALVIELQDNTGQPLALDPLPSRLVTERPLVLPKGQTRSLELPLYLPPQSPQRPCQARVRLLDGPGGSTVFERIFPALEVMPEHQYFFVVLARDRDQYSYLATLDSVRAPSGHISDPAREAHYRLVLPKPKEPIALPAQALQWTSIAYLLWDDRQPEDLSADQQQALVDWLHWGGQLIVSGPETLDTLRDSFLWPYLPAEATGTWQLDAKALATLYEPPWSRDGRAPNLAQPWAGVMLAPRDGADAVLGSRAQPLLVEHRVGRGRVIVSAFRLHGRDFVNWPGCDGLFNACLMRRPGRQFSDVLGGSVQVTWKSAPAQRYDPAPISQVRYLTHSSSPNELRSPDRRAPQPARPSPFSGNVAGNDEPGPPLGPGAAAWSDLGRLAELVRHRLREAAGIVVPDVSFVAWVLAAYLATLVPVNWAVFRLLGRVEWAWAAAPLVTIAFAILVVRLAELDIGFARARTEIAVLELQPGYQRAHLTRFLALYSSLGTSYDLTFDDPKAVAVPFPPRTDVVLGQARTTVRLRRTRLPAGTDASPSEQAVLDEFAVSSNTTAMIHSEQMIDLGGTISAERLDAHRWRVTNGTRHGLAGACLLLNRRVGWIGPLGTGESRELVLSTTAYDEFGEAWLELPAQAAESTRSARIELRELVAYLHSNGDLDDVRLVGWSAEPLPGVSIRPSTAQSRAGNLIVAHVGYGPLRRPETCLDDNTRAQVQRPAAVHPEPKN